MVSNEAQLHDGQVVFVSPWVWSVDGVINFPETINPAQDTVYSRQVLSLVSVLPITTQVTSIVPEAPI